MNIARDSEIVEINDPPTFDYGEKVRSRRGRGRVDAHAASLSGRAASNRFAGCERSSNDASRLVLERRRVTSRFAP